VPLIDVDELYTSMDMAREFRSSETQHPFRKALKKLFLSLYPVLRFMYSVVGLSMQIGYINRASAFVSPWHYLTKQKLIRISTKDYKRVDQEEIDTRKRFFQSIQSLSTTRRFYELLRFQLGRLVSLATFALPGAIFLFRFLEWWQNSDHSKKKDVLPIPPPPPTIPVTLSHLAT
jgi:hypothetical protein